MQKYFKNLYRVTLQLEITLEPQFYVYQEGWGRVWALVFLVVFGFLFPLFFFLFFFNVQGKDRVNLAVLAANSTIRNRGWQNKDPN